MSETKPCPYCGEEIRLVAVKCKHCGSNIGASSNIKRQFALRPAFVILGTLVLLIFGACFAYNWRQTGALSGQGFTDADVMNIEQSIRTEFGKRHGAKVEDVRMIKESPRKLIGFIKVRAPVLGVIEKSCTANFGDGGQSIWKCE